jgi:glycosyltransferase involved in cell wall biosynthesis
LIELPINGGPAAARNCGAAGASGSLLFLLDADILIRPDRERRISPPGDEGEVKRSTNDIEDVRRQVPPQLARQFGKGGKLAGSAPLYQSAGGLARLNALCLVTTSTYR